MNMAQLGWLHGQPAGSGQLKTCADDFVVVEDLGYQPDGDGEQLLVRLRKTGCNTRFVADALAKFVGIHPRDVSFAGMKDRHAVTEQTFCLRVPGKEMPVMSGFVLEGVDILQVDRHRRKIRTGALAGNRFRLMIRQIGDRADIESRLKQIEQAGVPNYFGPQRFGHGGNNVLMAQRWARNEIQVRERPKRSFYLSAARSAMFNQVTSDRLQQLGLMQVVNGDALQLTGRGSWFVAQQEELPALQQRVEQHELRITAPLPGSGNAGTTDSALLFEQQCLAAEGELLALLQRERVEAARRAMLVVPGDFQWRWWDDATLELSFWLPAGSFATAVVRELVNAPASEVDE